MSLLNIFYFKYFNFGFQLKEAESRISAVEVCDCIKSCTINGTMRGDGSSWQVDCDICTCVVSENEFSDFIK